MAGTNDFLPYADSGGANVISQATYAGSTFQLNGAQTGLAQSAQTNKAIRQPAVIASQIAQFIANTGPNVQDNGDLATLLANLTHAIWHDFIVPVAFSATPVFDASLGRKFKITLTENVTSSTLINLVPGMELTFIVVEDSTGGRTFVPPSNLPLDGIDTTLSTANIQKFVVDNAASSGLTIRPITPMMTSAA